jgi:hypothetical protein
MPTPKKPRFYTAHTQSVGESYFEHLGTASKMAALLLGLAAIALIHGLLPIVFVRTVSNKLIELGRRAKARQGGEKF